MKFSDETDKLFPALSAAQRSLEARIGKNATANTGKFKYDYVTLEEVMDYVRPACEANGLMIIQGSDTNEYDEKGAVGVVTAVVHVESGQYVRTRFAAEVGSGTPAQQAGIVISYGRRYELFSIFGLTPVGEDTDGNGQGAKISFKTGPPTGKYQGPKSQSTESPVSTSTPSSSSESRATKTGRKFLKGKSSSTMTAPALPAPSNSPESAFSIQPKE